MYFALSGVLVSLALTEDTLKEKKISFVDFKALLKSLIDLVGNTERQFDNCELKGNIESISCRTLAYLHICTLALSHTHKIFISDGSTCGQEV